MDDRWAVVEQRLVFRMRIIVLALVAGCSMFLVVTLVLGQFGVPPRHFQPFGYLALGLGAAAVAAQAFASQLVLAEGRRRILNNSFCVPKNTAPEEIAYVTLGGDRAKLMVTYFFRTLVSGAIFDAAAFFALIVYLALDRSLWVLTLAILVIGLILLQFPLRGQLEHWIQTQQRLLDDERQLRG